MNQVRSHLKGRAVLQIIPQLDAGGAEKTTVDIADALVAAGARSYVACDGGRFVDGLQKRGTHVFAFPAATKNPLRIIVNSFRLASLIRKHKIDILHARSRAPAWSALIAARLTKIPFITTYHGSYSGAGFFKILYNSVMARGDVVIANSAYTAGFIRKMHPFSDARIRIIHRGTEMTEFSPATISNERIEKLRTTWGVENKRVILLAARLSEIKGQKDLIAAMKLLMDRGTDDVIAILAGDAQGRANYVAELDRQIETLGLGHCVKRVGHCSDMPAAFALATLVAMPSTKAETFGRAAVEAQAMEKPVIVSDLGAVPETVLAPPDCAAAERTGWRIPPHDPRALADAMAEALALSTSERDALGRRARAHVVRNFSLDRMTGDTLGIYDRILSKSAEKPH